MPRSIGALYRSLPIPAIVRRSYADVLQSKYPAKPQSPVHKVFCTEELLEDILSHLPPLQLRNALLVCRRFRRCIDPKKCSRKMKRALGLEFTRRRWSDLAWEIYQLKRCYKIDHFHQNLLFNVSFSTSLTLGEEIVPVLQIAPFQRSSIMLSPGEDCVTIQLMLKSEDVNTEIRDLAPKGVVRLQSRGSVNMELYDDRYRHSWKDMKVVKAAVVVKVLIRVDFRKVMIADMHNIGHCGFPFCHVGSHGLQETVKCFSPQDATLGNLLDFLDVVEMEVMQNNSFIESVNRSSFVTKGRSPWIGRRGDPPLQITPSWN
ncbi:hypothetical protein WHR41_01738 [Cladosporium halotolerans]|uniref:F-box domain-containing protein n=1 Tax=Cladosporium halotolerans TaxID=1052096 RepID=A0AB34KZT6_9PEZI